MTRQELLTKLATECAAWGEVIGEALCLSWHVERESIRFSKQDWLAERERLLNKPSWKDAPDDATHLAIDSDKEWFFYSEEPTRTAQMWWPERIAGSFAGMAIAIPAGYDWRESLEARPV